MPLPAYMTMEGARVGKIAGSCALKDREGTIVVQAFDHQIYVPRDNQTGSPTGAKVHGVVTITKAYDRSSPILYQALNSGEYLKRVEIKWYRIDVKGAEEHYFTTQYEDALIVSLRAIMPNCLLPASEPLPHMEELLITYRKVLWRWEPDGIESEDEWQQRR